jgi:hypothetical protein
MLLLVVYYQTSAPDRLDEFGELNEERGRAEPPKQRAISNF